jgi:hypothetical protein
LNKLAAAPLNSLCARVDAPLVLRGITKGRHKKRSSARTADSAFFCGFILKKAHQRPLLTTFSKRGQIMRKMFSLIFQAFCWIFGDFFSKN